MSNRLLWLSLIFWLRRGEKRGGGQALGRCQGRGGLGAHGEGWVGLSADDRLRVCDDRRWRHIGRLCWRLVVRRRRACCVCVRMLTGHRLAVNWLRGDNICWLRCGVFAGHRFGVHRRRWYNVCWFCDRMLAGRGLRINRWWYDVSWLRGGVLAGRRLGINRHGRRVSFA